MSWYDDWREQEHGLARRTDPGTSWAAAMKVPVTKLERLFLEALVGHASLTTTEIANLYNMDRDTFSPRPPRLLERGLIEKAGVRLCRNSGGKMRHMIAFRITDKGRARLKPETKTHE